MADQNTSPSSGKKSFLAIAGVVILGLLVLLVGRNKSQVDMNAPANTNTAENTAATTKPSTNTAPVETAPVVPEPATEAIVYKDGTYSAVGTYSAPSGTETVGVELTLKDGIVTAVVIDQQAVHPTSVKLQEMFTSGVEVEVVGKSIADLSLTKVSGSSLTPKGFNDALEKIKAEAKA